jgi:hypothetical protein
MRWIRGSAVAMAALAAAVLFLPALAQEQKKVDITITGETAQKKTVFQSLNQFGSYGGSFGMMKLIGGDLGPDAQARPVLQGIFRYRFSDLWVGTAEFGFGWNALQDQGDSVVTFHFGTLGAARRVYQRFGVDVRAGAGAGFYRWNYKFKGKSLRDDHTQRLYRGVAPGGYLGFEAERRIARHVTLLLQLQDHYVATADSDQFASLFDQNHQILSFRLGANYHFSPYEGILWERKKAGKIRLESGKEGK